MAYQIIGALPAMFFGGGNKRRRTTTPATLPDEIIETILLRLPLREIRQLSILSKRFRHSWKLCRNLAFDGSFSAGLTKDQFKAGVTNTLYLLGKTGADRFALRYDAAGETRFVFCWVHRAIQLGVSRLELDFTPSAPKKFMLSSDIVNYESVTSIKLINCEILLPHAAAGGLRFLRDLTLQNMRARPVTILTLFRNCYELRSLKLINCNFIFALRIFAEKLRCFQTLIVKHCSDIHSICLNAPELQTFHFYGKICEIAFQVDTPRLNDVLIEFSHPRIFQMVPRRKEMIPRFAAVRSLTITSTFLEGFKMSQFTLPNLEEFVLTIYPESYLNAADIIIMLSNSPRIRRVHIDIGQNAFNDGGAYWKTIGRHYLNESAAAFPFLQYVKIRGFCYKEQTVMMAKFFLKYASSSLRCLAIEKARINNNLPVHYNYELINYLRWGIATIADIQISDYH
ncbi:putative FBD-associated F-box protein At1g61330 [Andrographis paniculata]|uniref:putative FBD-associated F-box protein At1g61330 n=1 Tax=Andrographis paniculata TaxID=175694 RepID=UPI0021E99C55|nr:putative FBD-associated F-box protein At1g61330 [Andrographis paniculata]